MGKKTKVVEMTVSEEAPGLLVGLRSIIFGAIDEMEFRISNLVAAISIATTEIIDQVFGYGKGLVLGLVFGVVGAAQTLVTQFFSLITSLVAVVIGSEE